MAERPYYRDNLAALRERFPERETITVPEAAAYLGVTKERLLGDKTFPVRPCGKQRMVVLVNMARWLAVV